MKRQKSGSVEPVSTGFDRKSKSANKANRTTMNWSAYRDPDIELRRPLDLNNSFQTQLDKSHYTKERWLQVKDNRYQERLKFEINL